MTTAWTVPVIGDLKGFMNESVLDTAGVKESVSNTERQTEVLAAVVARVRGAVGVGNRVAVSLTVGSVPPEAKQHALVLAVHALSATSPQLGKYVLLEAFEKMVTAAEDWVKAVQDGLAVTAPSDPDPANPSAGPTWGDFSGEQVAGVAGKVDLALN